VPDNNWTCLVTGGAGFIGSHLVDALVNVGHRVRVLDNLSTGNRANLAQVHDRIEFIVGDLVDYRIVQKATRGVDFVFHQAALASVPRSVADPMATHEACATGTLNVLLAARAEKVKRVIYAASSSAYGKCERLPKRESDPTLPMSPYAVAKLAGEQYCAAFTEVYGLETVRLRYFNIFGPRQPPGSPYSAVIPLFIYAMLHDRSPVIYGTGNQSRDFTYIDNAVQANLLAARATRAAVGQVYNVGCGGRVSLLELIDTLNDLLGTSIRPKHDAPRPGDVAHSEADISAARRDLGYVPAVDLKEGLRRTVVCYQSTADDTVGELGIAAGITAS
jgi:UDP-glucose 4-epimerase